MLPNYRWDIRIMMISIECAQKWRVSYPYFMAEHMFGIVK